MCAYEYKVVPAPSKGLKAKGVRTTQDRFANALQQVMNELGADGWEYQRTDALPCEEREGLMGKATHFQHMLVFRRSATAAPKVEIETPQDEVQPEVAIETVQDARPALKQPPMLDSKPEPTVAPASVPSAAPRPNMAAE